MNQPGEPASSVKFHWVEGKYRKDDLSVFTARFYLPIDQQCPPSAEDKFGATGTLIEGTCIEVNRGCFIATAAFGSELDPRVELLRLFRDEVLLRSELRDGFSRVLEWYYRFSPPIARAMRKRREAKLLLRYVLVYPVLIFVETFVVFLRFTHREWPNFDRF